MFKVDGINNGRLEASRHFRNKMKEYLKDKFCELETDSEAKNIRDLYRGISDCKRGYRSRSNIVTVEKDDMVTDRHSVLARCGKQFSAKLLFCSKYL